MSEARVHIDAQLQVRRDIEANWIAVDPVLRDGEIAYSKDVRRIKIGDGASAWSALDYLITDNVELSDSIEKFLKQLAELKDYFYKTEDGKSIGTKYNLFSEKALSMKGLSSGGGSEEEEGEGESGTTTGTYQMYKHVQSIPSAEWRILHGLGKMPNVKIVDSNTEQCYGDVFYESTDIVVIKFGGEFSGTAYLD